MITIIEKLFSIQYGQKEYHNKEWLEGNEGKNFLISSKGDDNGIYGFFNIKNYYKAPFITVPSTGTIGQAFVQENDCSVDDNCLVLIPQNKLSKEELFQVAFQIRLNKWKYKYGRQITPKRLAEQKIKLIKTKIRYKDFCERLIPKEKKREGIKINQSIRWVKLVDLCNIQKKKAPPQNQMNLNGNTPYITTSSKNNGVSNFVDEEPNTKVKCLTVALNGSVGETFFQFDDFITSGDNAVLTLKNGYNPYLLMFIGFMIEKQNWKYNYYQKLSRRKLNNFQIPIPFDKKGNIDLKYIESLIKNSFGFDYLKKYL